jgi:hypothetical protein
MWEYKTLNNGNKIQASPHELAIEGREGWELCSVLQLGTVIVYYFKRLKQ